MPSARRALIAGLGLIGGSIGMALRRAGWHITYLDPDVPLDDALRAGAADERVSRLDDSPGLLVLATPVDAALSLLEQLPAGSLVTSVCSVMAPLRECADRRRLDFVAGHPLAGSQQRGLPFAREDLFQNATWFVDRDDPIVSEMIAGCGASSQLIEAAQHDGALALTSHLPQLLSTALAALLERQTRGDVDDLPSFAGPGLRTFLRLAGSDITVWKPVLEANAALLLPHLEAIAALSREILEGDSARAFADANKFWSRIDKS